MEAWQFFLLVFGFAFVMITVVTAYLARGVLGGLAKQFPAQAWGAGAEVRERQSLSVGPANMSRGVTVALDAKYVHVAPGRVLKVFGGAPFSVPRAEIEVVKVSGKWATVRTGGKTIFGPTWCWGK